MSGTASTPRASRTAAPSCTPPTSASTIKHGDDGPMVVDGPFSEAKEVIGGFTVLEVPDLDAVVAVARTWPMLDLPGVAIEIRPTVEDCSSSSSRLVTAGTDGLLARTLREESGLLVAGLARRSATSTWPRRPSRQLCSRR